jgi:glycine dehydrogenase (decarboxylating) alpha subunit (EC 1.4.4.2)/glycine dehydrogenase (decarboxylating) beta subunit (EC 1.4.4.2)
MNFQTTVSDLTGLPLSNCSLLDEATAGAESATMMFNLRTRDQIKNNVNKLFVDKNIFPQTLAVISTRMEPQGIEVVVGDYNTSIFQTDFLAQLSNIPNSNGNIVDYKALPKRHTASTARYL